MEGFEYQEIQGSVATLTSTGDKFTFASGHPVEIIRWGLIADALIDVGAGMVVKADKVNSAGTRGDGDVGSISTGTTDVLAQDGIYTENVSPANTSNPTAPHRVIPGERVVFEVTDAADTAGATARIFVTYKFRPFQKRSLSSGGDELVNLRKVTA